MSEIEIVEHSSSKYAPRTYANGAEGHVTIALAMDYGTAGEKTTHKAAGPRYLKLPLSETPTENARRLYRYLRDNNLQDPVINVAGNGIYTLAKFGVTQESINAYLRDLLDPIQKHWGVGRVISGGQTGVDMAGIVAAASLGIPAKVHFPKGRVQRDAEKRDRKYSEEEIRDQIADGVASLQKTLEEPLEP